SVSCSGAIGATRWSISQTEWKPQASAAHARASMVAKSMRSWGRKTPTPTPPAGTSGTARDSILGPHADFGVRSDVMKRYDGQVAVVTGASSGIGRRLATELSGR